MSDAETKIIAVADLPPHMQEAMRGMVEKFNEVMNEIDDPGEAYLVVMNFAAAALILFDASDDELVDDLRLVIKSIRQATSVATAAAP